MMIHPNSSKTKQSKHASPSKADGNRSSIHLVTLWCWANIKQSLTRELDSIPSLPWCQRFDLSLSHLCKRVWKPEAQNIKILTLIPRLLYHEKTECLSCSISHVSTQKTWLPDHHKATTRNPSNDVNPSQCLVHLVESLSLYLRISNLPYHQKALLQILTMR